MESILNSLQSHIKLMKVIGEFSPDSSLTPDLCIHTQKKGRSATTSKAHYKRLK